METAETYPAVIAVADIKPPKKAGLSYTVYTEDGNELSIWPDKLGLIRTGEQYEVEINSKESNGRTYHNITGTPRHLSPYRAAKEVKPPATNGTKKMEHWTPRPRDPAEQRQIFVCALLGREIEHRDLMDLETMLQRAQIHAQIWDALFAQSVPIAHE